MEIGADNSKLRHPPTSRSSPDWCTPPGREQSLVRSWPSRLFRGDFRWHEVLARRRRWTAWFGAEIECERLSSLVDLVRFELTTSSMSYKKEISITCRQLGA